MAWRWLTKPHTVVLVFVWKMVGGVSTLLFKVWIMERPSSLWTGQRIFPPLWPAPLFTSCPSSLRQKRGPWVASARFLLPLWSLSSLDAFEWTRLNAFHDEGASAHTGQFFKWLALDLGQCPVLVKEAKKKKILERLDDFCKVQMCVACVEPESCLP